MEMSRKAAPLTSQLLIPDKSFRTNGCDCCQLAFAEVNWCRLLSVVVPAKLLAASRSVTSSFSHLRVALLIFPAGKSTLIKERDSIFFGVKFKYKQRRLVLYAHHAAFERKATSDRRRYTFPA